MRRAYALVLVGCGPVVHGGGEESTTKVDASSTSSTGEYGTSTSSSTTSAESSTSGAIDPTTTDESPTSVGFLEQPDAGAAECDVWAQNCPPGEKCIAWANDGGGAWNSLRCSPIAAEPKQVGDACTVVDSPLSGIDDCDRDAMCWNVDPKTLEGECVAMCRGSAKNPICDDPCTTCPISSAGVVILCVPPCDPVAQDCGDYEKCIAGQDEFRCTPDVQSKATFGTPCVSAWECGFGLHCAPGNEVPACDEERCCTPFCDAAAQGDCDSAPGTVCTPWPERAEQGDACLTATAVGYCTVPR